MMLQYDLDSNLAHRSNQYAVKVNSKSVQIRMSLREARLLLEFLDYIEKRRDLVFGHLGETSLGTTPRALETAIAKGV